eukprot:CAMPEP_0201868078 /NCGR_PEP_ID=MMETSP0902-20130614/2110_1 /ASSEMBLY_ACC=CAM_ASM_000551 /TAXON_ID=420261 /ORGANISM="Thalassiosira antarctica, Strain CCMP982" /LENGTH=444 /DNA_ID=CAMNT_0048393375 /DNA_START=123 /DNA_END=1457 /DNA_ORIENTATION=+
MSSANRIESFGKWVGHNLLFSEVLEADNRAPCLIFSMPDFILRLFHMEDGGNEFGLLAPRIEFWIALTMTLIFGAIFSSCLSCIMYQFIVIPRKRNNKQNNEYMTPFLVGVGIIMPLCALYPYYGLRYFHIKNKMIKFLTGLAQLTSFFRCSEAMFGFLPPNVDDSLTNLIIYNAFPVEVKFNANGAIKSTWTTVSHNGANCVKYILILGIYSSIMLSYDYQPYSNNEGTNLLDINILTGFSRQQLINNASIGILFQVYLTTFGFGINFLTSLCGVQQLPLMLNPIFESSSPSDFWGRRWNLVVHGILKRGVYKPVRTKYSRLTASMAAFVASGLFHEWLLSIVFYPDSEEHIGSCSPPICYLPTYGRNTLFFIWNAIVIGLEYAIGGAAIFQLFKKHLPLTLVSLLVASTTLPTAHWFTNDYVRSDFFKDAQIGFPLIVRVLD